MKDSPSPHLEELVGRIRPAIDATEGIPDPSCGNFLKKATLKNIDRSLRLMEEQSKIVRDLKSSGKLDIVGATPDIETEKLTFHV